MLRDHPAHRAASAAVGVVLTCGDPACRHAFEPDRHALATGSLACPRCAGWTFQAALAEPQPTEAQPTEAGERP